MEGKGPNRNTAIYKRQALYNGTLDIRRVYKLRLYVNLKTTYDNNIYTITSTYYSGSGNFTIYSTYPTLSNNP